MNSRKPFLSVFYGVALLTLSELVIVAVIAFCLSLSGKAAAPVFNEDPQSPPVSGDYYIAIAIKEDANRGHAYMATDIAELNAKKLPRNHYIYLCKENGEDGRVIYKNTETIETHFCDLALWGDNLVMKFNESLQLSSLFWLKLLNLSTGEVRDIGWFNNENPQRTAEHDNDMYFAPWSQVPVAEPNPLNEILPEELVPSDETIDAVKLERQLQESRTLGYFSGSDPPVNVDLIDQLPFYFWGGVCSDLLYMYVEKEGHYGVIRMDARKPDLGFELVHLKRNEQEAKSYAAKGGGDFTTVGPVGWHASKNPYAILNYRDTRDYTEDDTLIPGYDTFELIDLITGNITTAAYISLSRLDDGTFDINLSRELAGNSGNAKYKGTDFSPGEFWLVADNKLIWQPQLFIFPEFVEAKFPGYKLIDLSNMQQEYIPIPEGGDWLIQKLFAFDGGFVIAAHDPADSSENSQEPPRDTVWRYTFETKSWELLIRDGKFNIVPLWLSHDGRYLGVLDTTDLLDISPGLMKIGTIDLKKPDEGIVFCDGIPVISGYSQGVIRIPAEKVKF
jgi:hypothetical protein